MKIRLSGVVGPTIGAGTPAHVSKEWEAGTPLPRHGDWIAWTPQPQRGPLRVCVETVTFYPDEDRCEIRFKPHLVVPAGQNWALLQFKLAGFLVTLPGAHGE